MHAHILSLLWYLHSILCCQIEYSVQIRQTMIFLLLLQSAIVTGIQLWKWKRPAYSSFLLILFKLCCQCVSMLHSRSGQWSEPDSPDGLALMGALPVQHRLWQRPGVLHRREFVQTGQWRCILSSEQCITHIPRVSADGRYAGHWRLQGGRIRHGYNRRLLAWS